MEKGFITYEDLRNMLIDYYSNTLGITVNTLGIDYFKEIITGERPDQPLFRFLNEYGMTTFDITTDDIKEIIKRKLAEKGYELTTDLTLGEEGISYSCKENPTIKEEYNNPESKYIPDVVYTTTIDYNNLKNIIVKYYKDESNLEVSVKAMHFLYAQLTLNISPENCFISKGEFGEGTFSLTNDEIKNILRDTLKKHGLDVQDVTFGKNVKFTYKKNHERLQTIINKFGEIKRVPGVKSEPLSDDIPIFEPPKEPNNAPDSQPQKGVFTPEQEEEIRRIIEECIKQYMDKGVSYTDKKAVSLAEWLKMK